MGVCCHFLNVGVGDCTIVHFPKRNYGEKIIEERIMMIDIYNHNDGEYENVIEYYKKYFRNSNGTIKPIFRFICSHPHQDHICGLNKLFNDNEIEIFNFWDLDHSFEPEEFDKNTTHTDDWNTYKEISESKKNITVIRNTREADSFKFWNDEEDRITILSPSNFLKKKAHENDDGTKKNPVDIDEMSYALSIQINQRSVILAGDGRSEPVWNDIFANCKNILKFCKILKASHHGHECGFHEEALKTMNPSVIIFSNSKDEDENHGASDKYARACPDAQIYKTWKKGNVLVTIPFDNNKNISVATR
jgi:competence protein ComEC